MASDTSTAESPQFETPVVSWVPANAPPPLPLSMSPNINELADALARAQASIKSPPRNREVKVKTKTGGSYTFKYATLDIIIEAVRKPLTEAGLWFVQTLGADGSGKYRLTTTLVHDSGQWISSEVPLLVQEAGPQAFGSALSYMRRYSLVSILGCASDEDDDANVAEGNEAEVTRATVRKGGSSTLKPATKKPVAPVTLPVKPLPDGTGTDWIEWRTRYEKAIDFAPDLQWLNDFVAMNAAARGEYCQDHPRQDDALEKLLGLKRGALAQAPGIDL